MMGRVGAWMLVSGLVPSLAACSDDPAPAGHCGAQACEIEPDGASVRRALEGFEDPVADLLRTRVSASGVVGPDAASLLEGLGQVLGCDAAERSTFVVLSNDDFAPKSVLTQCSSDPTRASTALSIVEPDLRTGQLDAEFIRFAGWDEGAGRYRRYQMAPHPDGGLGVSVEPEFCVGCHGGSGPAWAPIMNEMTNPWAQWNATPGFESFRFDEMFREQDPGEDLEALLAVAPLNSASNLEPIIRAAVDRVSAAAVLARNEPASAEAALALLRPVFCDSAFNFVSEIHDSGELLTSAVVDLAVRRQYLALDATGWDWNWVFDDAMRIVPPEARSQAVALIGVRALLDVEAEAALVSRGVLQPLQVLRVRALDWHHPVGSAFRCAQLEAVQGQAAPLEADAQTNADLVLALYGRAMEPFETGSDALVAVPDIELAGLPTRPSSASLRDHVRSLVEWGDEIEERVQTIEGPQGRQMLEEMRRQRLCTARSRFVTTPLVSDVDC